jgi:hypothetical protein
LSAVTELKKLVDESRLDRSLTDAERFRERADALERLDAFDLSSQRSSQNVNDGEAALYRQALALRSKLEAANSELYESIRERIRRGIGREALLRWAVGIDNIGPGSRDVDLRDAGDSYDHLDELVRGVLRFATPDEPRIELSPEMVAYQPTPARHIFGLIQRTKLTAQDLFIDFGSGLGHVSLLVAICTEARALGIELEPSYVECARVAAQELRLTGVTFVVQDAREADLSSGTIFYFYTPFRGAILRATLDRLRAEAAKREIRVCTFGPCTPVVAAESWLTIDSTASGHISVFRSHK